jgi:small subunit ribosomal protein S2
MSALTLQDLLEAGTHFGHQTKRWNPKMQRFILCPRNGIYIVDLNKTLQGLDKFIQCVKNEVQKGGKVLFVGTKKQIKDSIMEEAVRCNMPYVTERWLGGMLTNFQTIRQSISKLEKIETMETDGTIEALPKKEVLMLMKKKEKLVTILTGIRKVNRLPAVMFVVDTLKEQIAISEARRLKHPHRRHRGHELQPRRNRLPHSRKRRRDQIGPAYHEGRGGRGFIGKRQYQNRRNGKNGKTGVAARMVSRGFRRADQGDIITEEDDVAILPPVAGAVAEDPALAKKHRVVRKRIVKFTEDEE